MGNDYTTDKPCCEEGCNLPRMISSSGHQLVRCQDHQRQEWSRRKKSNRTEPVALRAPLTERLCTRCKQVKPITQFQEVRAGNYRAVCIDCRAIQNREAYQVRAAAAGRTPRKPREAGNPKLGFKSRPGEVISLPSSGGMLLVDRLRRQVIVVQVIGEIPNGAKRLEHLIAAYQTRGLRIIEATERTEGHS